jgi:hypothetical protein
MALSERDRARASRAVQRLLEDGTSVRDYVVGHGHVRMTTGAMVALGVFATAFAVTRVVSGTVLFPGFLAIWWIVRAVRPLLGVAVTDRGLAVLHVSAVNGRPTRVLVLLPYGPVWGERPTGSETLALGPERVTFARRELDRLVAATATPPAPAPLP